jgi:hypothetical protein
MSLHSKVAVQTSERLQCLLVTKNESLLHHSFGVPFLFIVVSYSVQKELEHWVEGQSYLVNLQSSNKPKEFSLHVCGKNRLLQIG